MRTILSALLVASALAAGAVVVSGASPSPTPTPSVTPVPTPKPFPKITESIIFLGHPNMINGFISYGTPSPPSPKATGKASPKPPAIPSQENISGINLDCGFSNSGAKDGLKYPLQNFVPGTKAVGALPPCMGVYADAKSVLKLFNAKVKDMQIAQNPDPATIDWSKAKQYYRGTLTFTFCKRDYTQNFYMSKLASFEGKPMIDPLEFIALINPDLVAKYHVNLFLPSKAALDAVNKAKAPQPLYTLDIQGAIPTCKAKRQKTGYILELQSTTDGHDPQSGGEIHAVVKSHMVLKKSSGSLTFYKPVATSASTSFGFLGNGQITYESATLTGSKGCTISGTTPGTAYVALLGKDALAIGFPAMGWPQEMITCPYGGGPAPTWWGIFLYTNKSNSTVAGGFGGMPIPALVLPMSEGVDGVETFTSSYSGPNQSGAIITENSTITVTPCSGRDCH